MNEYTNTRNQNHHGGFKNLSAGNNDVIYPAAIPMNPTPLPPIRRINNYLPPLNLRMALGPRTEMGQAKKLTMIKDKNKFQDRYLDGESVMNLSLSGSGSESDEDDSYSDDGSEGQTTYSYADDEAPATNFSCMGSLFLPASSDQEMNDAGIFHCRRVGPSSAEVRLNIPLPAHYLNHRYTSPEGERSGYMHNVCKAPSLNYNHSQYDPALFEEAVVEIDPFKQYRERIAHQFYESLIEEDSDEDADTDDNENESDSAPKRDDSQIFGYFDAWRGRMQEASYSERILREGVVFPSAIQSPSTQIVLADSTSRNMKPGVVTPGEGSEENADSIELSLNGSSEVSFRPGDSQNSSLNHAVTNTAPRHATTSCFSLEPSTYSRKQAARSQGQLLESAPIMDESVGSSMLQKPSPFTHAQLVGSTNDGREGNDKGYKKGGGDLSHGAFCGERGSTGVDGFSGSPNLGADTCDALGMQRLSNSSTGKCKDDARPSLTSFPSFDEPGRIRSRPTMELKRPFHFEQGVEIGRALLSNVPIGNAREAYTLLTPPGNDKEDTPLDEIVAKSSPKSRFDMLLKAGISAMGENPVLENKVELSFKGPRDLQGRCASRLVLEETSKSNVKAEVLETSAKGETSEKSVRALRKDRIRTFDAVRPALAAATTVTIFDRVSSDACRKSQTEHLEEIVVQDVVPKRDNTDMSRSWNESGIPRHSLESDGVPDLDDLIEFHSCDDDFFASHTINEQFSPRLQLKRSWLA